MCELPAPLVLPLRVRLEVSEENAWGEDRRVLGRCPPHTPQLKSQKRIGSVAGDIAGAAADGGGGGGDVRLSFSYEVLNGGALGSFERLKGKALVPPQLPLSPVPGQTPAATAPAAAPAAAASPFGLFTGASSPNLRPRRNARRRRRRRRQRRRRRRRRRIKRSSRRSCATASRV